MIKKNFKGRCRKWKLEKCKDVMRHTVTFRRHMLRDWKKEMK